MTNPLADWNEKYFYEFDAFRVDPVRRRLLREGEVVPLTPKAFSILLILLENRREVVEKEELIRKVWGDAFVTEANLTQNISSLRKALGERANEHRFVVTVPGRGYSFVAEVAEVPREPTSEMPVLNFPVPAAPSPPPQSPLLSVVPPPPSTGETGVYYLPVPPPAAQPAPVRLKGRRRFLFAGLALGFLLAAVTGWLVFSLREHKPASSPPPAEEEKDGASRPVGFRPTVAVLGFRNLSGDPRRNWLSTALSEMLTTELAAGSKVRMVSGEEIARVKDSLSSDDPTGDRNLQQIHELLGAELVVVGSYLSLGEDANSKIRIDLRVVRAPSGDSVASLAEVGTEEHLFDLVSLMGGKLRRNLGWSDPSPEESKAVQALQPSGPEAARLYAEGLARLRTFDSEGARDLLQQAAEVDPRSAVIRSALSLAWIGLGHDAQAREEAEKAVQLSAALPKEERLAIEARFREAKQDWNKASDLYRSLWTFYPDNLEYGLRLANNLSVAGRNPEARTTVASLRKLPSPLRDDPRIDLVEAQIARRLGDPVGELRAARIALEKGQRLEQTQVLGEALLLQGDALYTQGRPEDSIASLHQAQKIFAEAGNQAALARTFNRIGAVMMDTGDFSGAEEHYQQALAIAQRLGSSELIATQTLALGFVAADLGDLERARQLTQQAHERFVGLGEQLYQTRSLYKLGEISWELGDLKGARQLYEEVLTQARKSGNRVEEARALNGLGEIFAASGELTEARSRQEQAFAMARSYGDPFLAASYLASLGQTFMLQGDLPGARRRLELALQTKRQVRDRLGTAQALTVLSQISYEQGNLDLARRYAAEANPIRAALVSAAALQAQARLDMAAGDFAAAHERLSEALRLSTSRGAGLLAAGLRLDLARLALAEGKPNDAERQAREVAQLYHQKNMPNGESRALALLSQALAAGGLFAEAKQVGEKAHEISEKSEELELQIEVLMAIAPAGVAAGEIRSSLGHLRWAVSEAGRLGYVEAGLQARLTLGALQIQTGDLATGRATLAAVQKEAAARGFKEIAQRAAALLAGRRVPLG